ncbi:MAG: radical SAM protein [Methylococcaceae bacterium]|nr:radical SAM protein [Methylococcaceae bacterium]MDZ4157562.1 radical SAM protein [Methylococcales bacterium]MDP2395079.1 radical SAM protein [Methylococcaceae bacterium]MDP3019330.1 radical SAM protein [Methylococcaceae bacterium]MDP3389090.1 radical SAM protein [Methylococcaceae bacterium]
MFSSLSKITLAKAALFQDAPVYVQFYVTARCNLTCEQCNIIYANSDVRECTLDEIKRIADNFAKMGVAIVLLTGGEPFARKDLPEIIQAFESRGVHVRMQTNGYASEEQIARAVEAGGKDISISLDSLQPAMQDKINGDFNKSWHQALKAMALFTKYLPIEGSFASLGCVLQPQNMGDIEDVVRFGSAISWFASLVPVHVSDYAHPRGFRTFDQSLRFKTDELPVVDAVIERVRKMRKEGFLLFDSDQYLDDIKRFVRDEAITWRSHNNNVCDTPNLYFALLPNGEFAPCCDHRLGNSYPAYESNFPKTYRNKAWREEVAQVTRACDGCMYGSYPEMTISMRYMAAKLQRVGTFLTSPPEKNWPLTYEQLLELAEKIRSEPRERPQSRQNTSKRIEIVNG